MAEVAHAIRDQGLPRLKPEFSAAQAADWLLMIVADQSAYHARNRLKLEYAEQRLRLLTQIVFCAAVVAVLAHFFIHAEWLLLFTAAGPAFAAALHGAETRLGIVHRAGFSHDVHRDLTRIKEALEAFCASPPLSDEAAWQQVRTLSLEAAAAMGQENTSWHKLLRRERDDLPA